MAFVTHQNQNFIAANIFEYMEKKRREREKKTMNTKAKKKKKKKKKRKKKVLYGHFSVSGISQSIIQSLS